MMQGLGILAPPCSAGKNSHIFFNFYLLIYLFLDRGRKRNKGTLMCDCLSHSPTGDLAHNPGLCPDWESNWLPFGLQVSIQSTEPHQPGQTINIQFLTPPKLTTNSLLLTECLTNNINN